MVAGMLDFSTLDAGYAPRPWEVRWDLASTWDPCTTSTHLQFLPLSLTTMAAKKTAVTQPRVRKVTTPEVSHFPSKALPFPVGVAWLRVSKTGRDRLVSRRSSARSATKCLQTTSGFSFTHKRTLSALTRPKFWGNSCSKNGTKS